YVVLSLAIFDYHLLRRREIDSPTLRMLGWIASLTGVTTIAAIGFPSLSPGPVIGPGGYLGALGKAAALAHFATVGGIILSASVMLGGLLLCTDYALIETAVFLYQIACLPRTKTGGQTDPTKASPVSKRNRTDLEDSLPGDVSVKIRGKPAAQVVASGEKDEDE